jgi:imidazolonepropionase-like amidohydrolase
MPGLIDAHTHLSFGEPTGNDELFHHRTEAYSSMLSAYNARKVLRAGVTSVLDADCLWNIGVELRDAIENGIVEGPRMRAGGQALMTMLGGTGGADDRRRGHHGYATVGAEPRHDGQRGPPPDQVRRRLDQDHGDRADPRR